MIPAIIITAVVAALIIAIIAYIADWFLAKAGLGFPRQILWLIAFLVWILWVFGSAGFPGYR